MTLNLSELKQYALDRLQESSTWRGFTLMATGMGAHFSEDGKELILFLGITLAGLLGAITKDKP